MVREAKIEKARRYSPAQEAARQAAVDEMMNQNLGFFASAMKGFMGMRERVLAGGAYTAEDGERVGRRKRSKRWDEEEAREQGLLNGATIPPERALVTVMVDDK